MLLLAYWAMNIPMRGQELALIAQQVPLIQNTARRLLEPLGAPDEELSPTAVSAAPAETVGPVPRAAAPQGVEIVFKGLGVVAAGHAILRDVGLAVRRGENLAIVGPSGAGKSSLVGLLLGWHRPAAGTLLVEAMRSTKHVGWLAQADGLDRSIGPVWNRRCSTTCSTEAGRGVTICRRRSTPRYCGTSSNRLPEGWQTPLGEGGALVSGGEGQRVRLARSLLRREARLVILDEPFRGLDRETRRRLLAAARSWWHGATLLCITHDVAHTEDFDRVAVMDGGRLVEIGTPAGLLADGDSRYASLLATERRVRAAFHAATDWRHLWLENGRLHEVEARGRTFSRNGSCEGETDTGGAVVAARGPVRSARSRGAGGRPTDGAAVRSRHGGRITAGRGLEDAELSRWAARLGLEIQAIHGTFERLPWLVGQSAPALLRLPGEQGREDRWLAVVRGGRRRIILLSPRLRRRRVRIQRVAAALARPAQLGDEPEVDPLLAALGLTAARQRTVRRGLLAERLRGAWISRAYLVQLPPGASFPAQLRQQGVAGDLIAFVGTYVVSYSLLLLSWWTLGKGALEGHLAGGWLAAWALLLLALLPARYLSNWARVRLTVRFGALLKRRLLAGRTAAAQRRDAPGWAGRFLGRVIESEEVESKALSGGFLAVVAVIELALSAALGQGAGGGVAVAVAAVWTLLVIGLGWRFLRSRRRWTEQRLAMTHQLIERMVGHRTLSRPGVAGHLAR